MSDDSIILSIQKAITKLEPVYVGHGGSIEFVDFDASLGRVRVKLTGACEHCGISGVTLKYGLTKELQQKFPQIKEVVSE